MLGQVQGEQEQVLEDLRNFLSTYMEVNLLSHGLIRQLDFKGCEAGDPQPIDEFKLRGLWGQVRCVRGCSSLNR